MPKIGYDYICLAAILTDFLLKRVEKYYSQILLKEYKYIEKEKTLIRYINNDLKISSD